MPRETGLERLALRYLEGYGPARPEDMAAWAGIKVSEARWAFQALEEQTEPVRAQGQGLRILRSRLSEVEEEIHSVRLLPRFDTFLLAYTDRNLTVDPGLGPADARKVYPGGGIINAVVLLDGQAKGVWKTQRRKRRLEVVVELFEPLEGRALEALEAEVKDVGRFLGEEAKLVMETFGTVA